MTIQELRYLIAIAEHRHFGQAALLCNVTQPTLSGQLRKLESTLGVVLIDRSGRQPVPTPIGERIVERARRLLAEADAILAMTPRRHGPLRGTFNMGLIPSLAPYYLPWLLPKMRIRTPELHLVVHEDITLRLHEKLEEQLLDAAFVALPCASGAGWVETPLFDEPFFIACPSAHPAIEAPTMSDQALRELPLMLLTEGHCLRGQALAACGHGASVQDNLVDCRATSLETLCSLVADGMGCTLLPALAVRRQEQPGITIRPLQSGQHRRIGLVWRASHPRASDLALLAEHLGASMPPGVLPPRD